MRRRTLAPILPGIRPCSDCPLRSPAIRPFVARRSSSCRPLAQGSGRAEDGEEAAGWGTPQDKSEHRSGNHHDDNLRKQARTAVKHGLQAEQLGQRGRGANIISAHISFSPRAAIAPLLDWLPRCVAHDFCVPENSVAFGHDSSFFAVTQQLRTCVRRMLRCRPACIRPPSSLNPRLASGVVAVAEDEGRDRFIRDRRPLDCRGQ